MFTTTYKFTTAKQDIELKFKPVIQARTRLMECVLWVYCWGNNKDITIDEWEFQTIELDVLPDSLSGLLGWTEVISGARAYDELPPQARAYVARLEELAGVPIDIISVGPEREQTILLRSPFAAQ